MVVGRVHGELVKGGRMEGDVYSIVRRGKWMKGMVKLKCLGQRGGWVMRGREVI